MALRARTDRTQPMSTKREPTEELYLWALSRPVGPVGRRVIVKYNTQPKANSRRRRRAAAVKLAARRQSYHFLHLRPIDRVRVRARV